MIMHSSPAGPQGWGPASRSHFSRDPSEYFKNVLMEKYPYGYHPRGVPRRKDTRPRPGEERWAREDVIRMGEHNVSVLLEDFRAQHDAMLDFYDNRFSGVFNKATRLKILAEPVDLQKKFSWVHDSQCSALALRSHGLHILPPYANCTLTDVKPCCYQTSPFGLLLPRVCSRSLSVFHALGYCILAAG